MITLRGPILVSRKLAMRHEPDIGERCSAACSKIKSFPMKNTRLTTSPPLTHAHRVYIQNVTVYAGTTRTCVSTCARGAGIHGDVFKFTHGDVSACHTTPHHTTPHTPQHKTQDTTHNTNITQPQQPPKTEKEDREREEERRERRHRQREKRRRK